VKKIKGILNIKLNSVQLLTSSINSRFSKKEE